MTEIPENQILTCNKLSMEWLRKGNILKSEEYISKAQHLLTARMKSKQTYHLWAITYNNLGCIYKRKGELDKALKFLELGLEKEENFSRDVLNLAGIHLNISAIYSSMNSHDLSLKHALSAKKVLLSKPEKDQNIWVSLVIAYQSAGFEHERLGNQDSARDFYLKGWEIAQDHLGAFHTVTEKIKKNYQTLNKVLKISGNRGSRSKTPSLYTKPSNISLASGKNSKVIRDNSHGRAESIKNFDTLDLLISEIELGKSESSTEVQSKSRPERPKNSVSQIRKIQFEKLPKLEEKDFNKIEDGSVGVAGSDDNFKIETDDECSDLYADDFEEEKINIETEIEANKSLGKDLKAEETLVEIESEPLDKSALSKTFVEKESQTELVVIKNNFCQTVYKPTAFRRVAAIIIQKYWRLYKRRTDPYFFRFLDEVQSARLEAQHAMGKINKIKISFRNRPKIKSDEPVPMYSKVRV